ncbi:GntR family transcriptional regulator [Nocardia sp. alder85J]|uniref:GntR family transcriptional regulator n=1 Tax=Nocardia sp. alder85J TaxID=2862949 RepID=UPI001CD276B6|nr:GntR family transcriptional regulator [Nocardia sp. alder85J]MCX4095608.1 GntR family transcriptional regulator [Nocardia sp. alder85J]
MVDSKTTIKPVQRSRLVDEVVERLRTLILSGELPPGHTLLQIELCERLGVSRTPLREAFRRLEREGFARPSNGNNTLEVVSLTPDDLRNHYQVREVVDGLAARLAAKRGVEAEHLDRLRGLVDHMRTFDSGKNWPRRAALHADLHANIAELSGNRQVVAQIPMIRFTAQMLSLNLNTIGTESPETIAALLGEGENDHREILDAIEAGQGQRAERAARRHIRKTMSSLLIGS